MFGQVLRQLVFIPFLALIVGVSACATPSTPVPVPTAAPTLALHATPTLTPPPTFAFVASTSTPQATRTLPAPPTPTLRFPVAVTELAKGFGGPDDLALMPDGTIVFSDVGNGTINDISHDGKVTTLLRGLSEPEGIVVLPDGALIVAEQGKNRLIHFRPNSGQPPTNWFDLENKTGKAGVDGITLDAVNGDVIVPDSPNGRILDVSADGKSVRVVATGLARPTGAAIERDGSLIIADEYGNTVKHIRSDGRVESLGHFATPDDVAVDAAGNIFVTSLGDDSVRMIDVSDGVVRLVASIYNPQGVLLDQSGNLVVTEAGLNRIVRLTIH